MAKPGSLTVDVAKSLNLEGHDVFYDHGDPANPNVGKIVSSIENAPAMGEELSQLDIAIIERSTKRALALIEIEETADNPKTFLGDLFGILTGNSISFDSNSSNWKIGSWTTLIILGKGKNHERRLDYIRGMALKAKSAMETENSKIGHIVIGTFSGIESLKTIVREQIEIARRRNI